MRRYKAEGTINASPETVYSFVDPSPNSPRCKWDKAIKGLQVIEQIDKVFQTQCSMLSSRDQTYGVLCAAEWFNNCEALYFHLCLLVLFYTLHQLGLV